MKKTIAAFILVFMLCGLLSACTAAENPSNVDNSNNQSNVQSNIENESNETPDGDKGDVDLPSAENPNEEDKKEDNTSPENPSEEKPENPVNPENPDHTDDPSQPEDPVDPAPLPDIGSEVGDRFDDLTLTTLSGEEINTADLRGKIVVFNIWATWCPPCKAELPDFDLIAKEYAEDVVIVAAHCYDSYMYSMPSYVATNLPDTSIIFAYDNSSNSGYYAAGGYGYVPQTAIIDKTGVIIYTGAGALSYEFLVNIIEENK